VPDRKLEEANGLMLAASYGSIPIAAAVFGGLHIVRHPALRSLSYGPLVSMFGGGVLFAVGIGYVHQTLGGSDAAFGWLAVLWGVGVALGFGAVRLLPGGGRPREFVAAVVACGLVLG
jgi:hypothetical protein